MALNVSLPKKLEARVREHVASGRYGSASEVVREALRLFEIYQSVQQSQLALLKTDITHNIADRLKKQSVKQRAHENDNSI
jgi:antitoxin ParD1/3/4